MPNPSLRTRLLKYAESQASAYGVHPTILPRVVDRVIKLHQGQRERRDERMLQTCIRDHLYAEDTSCKLSAIVRWTGPDPAPELDTKGILRELSRRDFTNLDDVVNPRATRFTMRSSLTPSEARAEIIEAIRQIIGDETEGSTWLLIDDEVRCAILEPTPALTY